MKVISLEGVNLNQHVHGDSIISDIYATICIREGDIGLIDINDVIMYCGFLFTVVNKSSKGAKLKIQSTGNKLISPVQIKFSNWCDINVIYKSAAEGGGPNPLKLKE